MNNRTVICWREDSCQQLLTAWRKNGRYGVKISVQSPAAAEASENRRSGGGYQKAIRAADRFYFLQRLFQLTNQFTTEIAQPRFIVSDPR
jgi:hypothetical protein